MAKRKRHWADFLGSQAAIDGDGDICEVVGVVDAERPGLVRLTYPGPHTAGSHRFESYNQAHWFSPIGPIARELLKVRK